MREHPEVVSRIVGEKVKLRCSEVCSLQFRIIDSPNHQRNIVSAEAEAVVDRISAGMVHRCVRDVIQITFRIRGVIIDGGWQDTGGEGQSTC